MKVSLEWAASTDAVKDVGLKTSLTTSLKACSGTSSIDLFRRESCERSVGVVSLVATGFGSMNECVEDVDEPSEKSDGLIRDSGAGPLVRVCEYRA